MRTKNYDHMICGCTDMVCNGRTDRERDGWMEKGTYRGGCRAHLKNGLTNL